MTLYEEPTPTKPTPDHTSMVSSLPVSGELAGCRKQQVHGLMRHRWRNIWLWLALFGFGAVALVACATQPPLVTPREVPQIMKDVSALNNKANASLSLTAQAKDESGSALYLDDFSFRYLRAFGYKNAGSSFSLVATASSVPEQEHYPLEIATMDKTVDAKSASKKQSGDTFCNTVEVLKKTSSSSKWKVVEEPITNMKGFPRFRHGTNGYGVFAASKGLSVSLAKLPGVVSNALESAFNQGSAVWSHASFLIPSSCISAGVKYNTSLPASHISQTLEVRYLPQYGEQAFALDHGALVFLTVQMLKVDKVITNGYYITFFNNFHDRAGLLAFYHIPPLSHGYSSTTDIVELAIWDKPVGSKAHFEIIGAYGYMTAKQATPIS